MEESSPYLTLKLDTDEPIELGAFVGAFVALGNEFDRFLSDQYPDWKTDTQVFVREVRTGCIEADMVPNLVGIAMAIDYAAQLLVVEDFVKRWGSRLTSLIKGNTSSQPTTKSELDDWLDATQAIANDPKASARLEAATFKDGKRDISASFQFSSHDARIAQQRIHEAKARLEKTSNADYERVLMIFTRSDVNSADVGKRSGERARIASISDKPLAILYASSLAEERIKHEIRDAVSVYVKGFVVDVNVESRAGKPVAYAITHVHDVLDLSEDD